VAVLVIFHGNIAHCGKCCLNIIRLVREPPSIRLPPQFSDLSS
jgi:hypothetical protein